MTLTYSEVRKLSLDPATHPRGRSFLSAASGLVRLGRRHYVVADDEQHLGVFDAAGPGPVQLLDLESLYEPLGNRFTELNIEGAVVSGDDLMLLQRGNKGGPNATARFAWSEVEPWLLESAPPPKSPAASASPCPASPSARWQTKTSWRSEAGRSRQSHTASCRVP